MSIKITISPETAVQAGARWRIVDGRGQGDRWFGSGEIATDLEPCHYRIEFTTVAGWKEPQGLKVRNVDGFTTCKTVVYKACSFYELGQIPPQTVWHDQLLEFMIPIEEARAIDVSGEPRPVGELILDRETGLFRYKPAPDDKFPFLVTLAHKDGEKKQTFEVTPMPILPPEVDVFGGRPVPQHAAPLRLQMAPLTVTPLIMALDQGREPPPPPMPFSEKVPIVLSTFLETQPAVEPSVPRVMTLTTSSPGVMAFPTSTHEAEQPIIDTVENEAELFNNELRTTRDMRIIGEHVILGRGLEPYDTIHENPAIKCLDIYGETVTICGPLHLPQTTVRIHARELRFEDQSGTPSYLSTTPLGYSTAAAPSIRQPVTDGQGQAVKDATGREVFKTKKAGSGDPGASAGDVSLHIESLCAPDPSKKRFILVGGRGQNPGTGLDGRDGAKLEDSVSYGWGADMGNSGWRIVYGTYAYKRSFFYSGHHSVFGIKAWPTNGEPGEPAGKPGRGGDGGKLVATLDLTSRADLSGGSSGKRDRTYKGGKPGEPGRSVMVKSENWDNGSHWTRSWDYLEHDGKWSAVTQEGAAVTSPAGREGSPGKATHSGNRLSWLDPLLVNAILGKAKECYLLGDLEAAQKKIAEYAELLDIYQCLEAWNDLDDTAKLELGRNRNEMAGLLARLNCHLDYFGNPAGWVPMLSFEVNRTIFDNEIDRALDLLYMTYWLSQKAKGDQQAIDALEQLQVKLKKEIEDLKEQYTKAAEVVPGLELEASKISNDINLLQQKLKNLEEELRQKAEEQLEETWWKTGLKIAGTLCSVVPVYQPALGAVGGLMNLGADFDKDDPWKTITGAVDIAAAFSEARVGQKKQKFESASKKVDTKSKEFKALKSAQNLQKATTALSKSLEGVAGVMAERQAPKSEVDALLLKLEAESEEFKQLSGEISTLLERKMDFAQKLADAMHLVVEIPNVITTNLLAIDSASSATAKGKNVLHDGRLTTHLDAVERRAKERLLKYHYYLAKSYEYRLLQRYQGQLDLDKVFNEMEQLAELNMQGGKTYQLSKEQFGSLKGVYQDTLSSIAEEILAAYNVNPPELSAPVRFNLTPNEIYRLNAGEPVSLNLMDLALFQLSEENVRIVDLEVESLKVSKEGGKKRRLAELDLNFEHSGISQLQQAGRTVRFRHSAGETANPIAWGARYDAIEEIIDAIKPSAASDSLLRSLLKSDTAGSIMLYSRPAAWANITVRREVNADPGTVIKIEDLRIKVSYDFTRESPGVRTIKVKAAPESANLKPYFMLDQVDLTNRRDGRGAFYRAYQGRARQVQIVAQDSCGRWRFDQWTDKDGNTLGQNPCLTVGVDRDQVLRAVYILP